jgi:succinate dehydrogenase/fumarate reductase flavoprotein subunit
MKREAQSILAADVIVVGGGGSGLAAAIGAAEAGASVVLLEKNLQLGGTTRLSIGSITATGTPHQIRDGVHDSPQEHFEDMEKFAGALASKDNKELRRILVENVPDTFSWLLSLGIRFYGPMPEPPHRKPRMHNVLPNSGAYIYALQRRCVELNIDIRTDVRASGFLLDGDRVAGVATAGASRVIARRGVILTSGDYSGSRELKGRFAPDQRDHQAINPTSTGDGQLMCERLGCAVINGELVSGPHLRFVPPPSDSWIFRLPPHRLLTSTMAASLKRLPLWLLRPFILSFVTTYLAPEAMMFREGAILVNRKGERFADELATPAFRIPEQPEGDAYLLFDAAFTTKFSAWPYFVSTAPGLAYAYVPDYKRTRPDIYHEATTLGALANQIDVPAEALEATIERYNKADRRGTNGAGRPAVAQSPFAALGPVKAWTVLTDGGVAVTVDHEVCREDGRVVPGLYAAGSVGQGGLLLEGHGHHLGWAFTSGRRAGRRAAANAVIAVDGRDLKEV